MSKIAQSTLSIFIQKKDNSNTIKDSLDHPGLKLSGDWRISRNKIRPGDRVGFTESWTDITHTQGTVVDKYQMPGKQGRFGILFVPDNDSIDPKDLNIKNKYTEKNYLP